MTSEPPEDAKPFRDFTHRPYQPFHEPDPTPKGVPYNEFYTPQKLGSLLFKVAAKKLAIGNRRASKGTSRLPAGKPATAIAHGRK